MTSGAARVRWYTNDMSGFVDNTVTGYVIMVLQTERGPVGVPQIVDNLVVFSRRFGRKVPWTTDPLIAEMALREGARLIVIRACSYSDVHDPTSTMFTAPFRICAYSISSSASPSPRASSSRKPSAMCTLWRMSLLTFTQARHSDWWESRVAARPQWADASCNCTVPLRAA